MYDWLPIILVFAIPVLIAGYFSLRRSLPLTDAMRDTEDRDNTATDR